MRKVVKWLFVVIVFLTISGCKKTYIIEPSPPCSLSATIDAPSYNLNNRHYESVCSCKSRTQYLSFLDSDYSYFELSTGLHELESKRSKDPSAELRVRILQKEIPFEYNKKYYFEPSGDYLTSNNYCIIDVRLCLDGECYYSNDGWVKVTEATRSNGEPFVPGVYSPYPIDHFKCEFEFTVEKDGKKVVVKDGRFSK